MQNLRDPIINQVEDRTFYSLDEMTYKILLDSYIRHEKSKAKARDSMKKLYWNRKAEKNSQNKKLEEPSDS